MNPGTGFTWRYRPTTIALSGLTHPCMAHSWRMPEHALGMVQVTDSGPDSAQYLPSVSTLPMEGSVRMI